MFRILPALAIAFLLPFAPHAYRYVSTPSAATLDRDYLDAMLRMDAIAADPNSHPAFAGLEAKLDSAKAAGDEERKMDLMIGCWSKLLVETRSFAVDMDRWFGAIQSGIERGTYRLSDFSPKTIEHYRNWLREGSAVDRMPAVAELMASLALRPPYGLTGPDRVYAQKKADREIAQVLSDPRIVAAINGE